MALYKRDGSPNFWIEFLFNGTRYRESTGTRRLRKAEEYERKRRLELHDAVKLGHVPYEAMRFEDAVKRYVTTHLKTKERDPKTHLSDVYTLARLTTLLGADTLLDAITTPVVAKLKEKFLDEQSKPATVNKYLATLRAILRMAHFEWGCLKQLPRFKLFKLDNERTRWLRAEEEVRLLRACERVPHLRDLIVFLIDTGARLGEATRLRWKDVDLPKRGRGAVRFMVTKTRKPRSVPMTRRVERLLRGLLVGRTDDQDRVFVVKTPGCRFRKTGPQAKPFTNPHGAWQTATGAADLEDVRLHDLRHTFASRLVQRGVPLLAVSQLLGHKSLRMTTRYAHLAPSNLKEAVAKLD
jgi:integrase